MIVSSNGGVLITVRVIPRAGRSGIAGVRDGALLVRLGSAPVDGAANAELVEVLAAALGVPKRSVTIVTGERSRRKQVRVAGVSVEAVSSLNLERLIASKRATGRPKDTAQLPVLEATLRAREQRSEALAHGDRTPRTPVSETD